MTDSPFDDPFSSPFESPAPTYSSSAVTSPTSHSSASSFSPAAAQAPQKSEDPRKFEELLTKVMSIAKCDADGYVTGTNLRPVLSATNLSMKVLKDIWTLADETKRGSLSKEELRRAMQLIALAQQGKPVTLEEAKNSKTVLLPVFYDLDSVSLQPDFLSTSAAPASSSSSYSSKPLASSKYPHIHYQELLDRETIRMDVIKEKGGTLIKYTNYIVKSDRLKSEVTRRYSDFVWLQETLLKRYPFRIIPALPPKGVPGNEDDSFVETRRRGLMRFLEFLGRHPVLRDDETLYYFLTETSIDSFANTRKNKPPSAAVEEIFSSPVASNPKKHIPTDAEDILRACSEKIPIIAKAFNKLVETMERICKRAESDAVDFTKLGHTVEAVIEAEYAPEWLASEKSYKTLKDRFESIGRVKSDIAQTSTENILESLKHHQNIITGFQELMVRRTQTTQKEHQAIVKRVQSNKEKLSSATAKGKVGKEVDTLVQQIEKDEQGIAVLRNRDDFATYCIWNEMIHFNHNKAFVSVLLKDFVRSRAKSGDQETSIWRAMQPLVEELPTIGF